MSLRKKLLIGLTGACLLTTGCRHCCRREPNLMPPGPLPPTSGAGMIPATNLPVSPMPSAAPPPDTVPFTGNYPPITLQKPELLLPEPLPPVRSPGRTESRENSTGLPEGIVFLGIPQITEESSFASDLAPARMPAPASDTTTSPPPPSTAAPGRKPEPPAPILSPSEPFIGSPRLDRSNASDRLNASDSSDPPNSSNRSDPFDRSDRSDSLASPALPIGIPQFVEVKPGISCGLRPDLDGLRWLEENHYKTVVSLRRPNEEDTVDRRAIEKRGLTYVSLTLGSEAISPETFARFRQLVEDRGGHPLFIYDRNGSLSGILWYLYFRQVEQRSDTEATERAQRLGLRDKDNAEQAGLWRAAQKLLQTP